MLSACNNKDVIGPKATGTTGNITTGGGTSTSTAFQPLTTGSTWKYAITDSFLGPDEINVTITGTQTTINGNTYFDYTVTDKANIPVTDHYYSGNHIYVSNEEVPLFSSFISDIPYFKDDATVNQTWKIDWIYFGVKTGTLTGTMKEADVTRVVNGVTFKNVYHTQVAVDLDQTLYVDETIDYYIAKGIGIIEESVAQPQAVITTKTIESYTIK